MKIEDCKSWFLKYFPFQGWNKEQQTVFLVDSILFWQTYTVFISYCLMWLYLVKVIPFQALEAIFLFGSSALREKGSLLTHEWEMTTKLIYLFVCVCVFFSCRFQDL